jgi:hypothetical protein
MASDVAMKMRSEEEKRSGIAASGMPNKVRTITVRASKGERWTKGVGSIQRYRRWWGLARWVYVRSVATLPSGKIRVTIEDVA